MRSLSFYGACVFSALAAFKFADAQEATSRNVVVTGENEEEHDQFTEMGEYAQPAWAE